jgi:hypothetical protein
MATPWQQVLQQVPSLNRNDAPFSYTVENQTIVGFWDVAKIEMLGLTGGSTLSKEYRVDVTPAGDDTVDVVERGQESESSAGSGGLSFGTSSFKGTSTEKSFGVTVGAAGSSHGEPTGVASYSFDTDAIKGPLMGLLEQHGWKKKGLLGKLFG